MFKERVTAQELLGILPLTAIQNPEFADVEGFEADFRAEADKRDKNADPSGARAFRLLAALCGFHFRPGDQAEPFSYKASFSDGTRTLVGSDFDKGDIAALCEAAQKIKPLPLKVRLCDLVWTRDKTKNRHARVAIDGYVELVTRLLDGKATLPFERFTATSISVQNFLERSFVIARGTGWDNKNNDQLKLIYFRVLQVANVKGGFALARFSNLGLDYGVEGTQDHLGNLSSIINDHLTSKEFEEAIALQNLKNRIDARNNCGIIPIDGHLTLAKIHEAQADCHVNGSFLQKHSLQRAIEALHGAKGVKEERIRLHARLKEAQIHVADELQLMSHSMDISDEVSRMLEPYKTFDLLDALRQLALTELPNDPDEMFTRAREEIEQFPLSSLFSTSILDAQGRTIARTGEGFGSSEALRYKVIQHFGIKINVAVKAAIAPARSEITRRFTVDETVLAAVCAYSPFVPAGYENQVARGMHAFLYGDDLVASTVLIPFLEAGLRELVVAAGRSDTTISANGIEQSIGLRKMLDHHRDVLEEVFGKAHIFAIENLFIHDFGPKVRNKFCHGLTVDGAFYSDKYVYACKMVYSLVFLPLLKNDVWKEIKPILQNFMP